MIRTTRPFSVAMLAFTGFLVSLPASQAAPFKSASGAYSITPPQGWTRKAVSMNNVDVAFVTKPVDGITPRIVVVVIAVPANTTLAKTREIVVKNAKSRGNKIVKQGFIVLGGSRAYDITTTMPSINPSLRSYVRNVMVVRGRKMYSFVYATNGKEATFKKYAPDFNKAMASLKWTK